MHYCMPAYHSTAQHSARVSCNMLTAGLKTLLSVCNAMCHCRVSASELDIDPAANLLTSASEEAQKVARNEGKVILHDTNQLFTAWAATQLCSCMLFSMQLPGVAVPAAPLFVKQAMDMLCNCFSVWCSVLCCHGM